MPKEAIMTATKRLRTLLNQPSIVMAPGCHDALGAFFIQRAGFQAAYVSGYAVACSLLGRPDLGELTMTEIVAHAGRIASAVEIPVICDADTGYGGPLNVQRTVREFQKAGVAAIHIEDQVEPKRCAAMEGFQVTAIGKIRAAVAAKTDPDFVIIARTDSRPILGLEHAIERARAFADAGADMVYVELLGSRREVEEVARAITDIPLLYDMFDHPKVPVLSADELEQMGYKIVTFPFTATLACAKLLDRIYPAILQHKGIESPGLERMAFHEFETALGLENIWKEVFRIQNAVPEED
jgi:2-methylisocitrate lyase-like PEP mutase family enzyme